MQLSRRRWFAVLASTPGLVACEPDYRATAYANATATQRRFKDFGAVLYVDAVEGAEMLGLELFADGSDRHFYRSSSQSFTNNSMGGYPGGILVPMQVRAVWRDSSDLVAADGRSGGIYSGNIIADHTVSVAPRIPDAFIATLRKERGSLRLKFRLHPDGLLFGWDMQVRPPLSFEIPDGDFAEAKIFNGQVVRKGWYIHPKTKQRIETNV
jgi:hypothetical protein